MTAESYFYFKTYFSGVDAFESLEGYFGTATNEVKSTLDKITTEDSWMAKRDVS